MTKKKSKTETIEKAIKRKLRKSQTESRAGGIEGGEDEINTSQTLRRARRRA